jgi:hypothetical protein
LRDAYWDAKFTVRSDAPGLRTATDYEVVSGWNFDKFILDRVADIPKTASPTTIAQVEYLRSLEKPKRVRVPRAPKPVSTRVPKPPKPPKPVSARIPKPPKPPKPPRVPKPRCAKVTNGDTCGRVEGHTGWHVSQEAWKRSNDRSRRNDCAR